VVRLHLGRGAQFTSFKFRNASSPKLAHWSLDENHQQKLQLILAWIKQYVKDKSVLDVFCANGAFPFEAALAGAREVVGIDFSRDRIACGNLD
jgi:tRNA (mo5U34)-methyltransferase